MTVKELKNFLSYVKDEDANVIMQDANGKLCDIRARTETTVAEKDTASSIHTYERKEIVVIY